MWMGEVETLTKLIYLQFWSHLSAIETSMAGLRVRISIFDTRDCTRACGLKSIYLLPSLMQDSHKTWFHPTPTSPLVHKQ